MENNILEIEYFKKQNFSNLSEFFISIFGPKILSVSISEKHKFVIFVVNLNEKF